MSAQRGFTQLILLFAIVIAVGLTGFFLLNKQSTSLPVPENHQEQPQQSKDNNNQPQGGYGFKQPFYQKGGISLQHYWPSDGNFSAEETEILLSNESNSDLQVKSFDLIYSVEGKVYPYKSGTWEKFPTKSSWERAEYLNISPQYYTGQPLDLARGEKGKLHWHINFGPNPLDGKQSVKVKLTLIKDGQTINIDKEFNRDSGTVFSKENH